MRFFWLMSSVLAGVAGPLAGQPAADSAAAKAVVRDYLVAWYDGDAALMEQVLHPELAKRNVGTDAAGRSRFGQMGAMAMVRATRGRTRQPADQRLLEVTLLDLQGGTASAKVVSWDFIDYVHLAKVDGRWMIINDLWSSRPK
ncbi:MAG: nuclear transport factor 2 family protein [Gemmatimonadales bacterium]